MTKVGCVVQARMGSTRLPGKSLLPLAGKPLVFRVLQRIKRITSLDEVILATSNLNADDVLVDVARSLDIPTIRGSEQNVAERFEKAIKQFDLDVVVRIPADNYLTEVWAVNQLIETHFENRDGFTTNIMEINNSGFPDGVGGEAFEASDFLTRHSRLCPADTDEHVHKHFYTYSKDDVHLVTSGAVRTCSCPSEYSYPSLKFDINTEEEYVKAKEIYDELCDSECSFGLKDVIDWMAMKSLPPFC